jgi:hydroxypyruvate isomerase
LYHHRGILRTRLLLEAGDLLANLDLIGHIHVAESPGRTAPVAQGVIDYHAIIPPVLAAGYQGYWGLEYLPQGDPLTDIAAAATFFTACATPLSS